MSYDTIMRMPFLSWVVFCAVLRVEGLVQYIDKYGIHSASMIHLAMQLSTVVFLLLMAAAVVCRTRPSGKAGGLEPRVSALAGTFLMYGMVLFPRHDLSSITEIATTLVIAIGSIGSIIALSQLGRSFSIMAESRQLVTTGPYKWVRHPLYLAEEIAMIGVFLQFASIWTAMIFAAQIAFQLRRIHNEEAVLTATFPEYTSYQGTTFRLLPGVY